MNVRNPMNRGYRWMFWSAFLLLLLWGEQEDEFLSFWRLLGLCLAVSGTGILYGASGIRRFYYARMWSLAGAVFWILNFFLAIMLLPGWEHAWEMHFLLYGVWAVIFLQMFMNVLTGSAELSDIRNPEKLSKWGMVFAITFTLSELAAMAADFLGPDMLGMTAGSWAALLLAVFLVPGILIMRIMALLRQQYFSG